jgi:hypothetical protein
MTTASPGNAPAVSPIVIDGVDQLRALLTDPLFRSKRPILLRFNGLAADQVQSLDEALNRDRLSCGCGLGAAALLAGLATSGAWVLATLGAVPSSAFMGIPIVLVTGAVTGGVGKAIGIAWSQHKAKRTVLRLLDTAIPEARAGLATN